MRATIDSAITLPLAELPQGLLKQLLADLSFSNPLFVEGMRRSGGPGSELEEICFAERQGDFLRIPRGAVDLLRRHCAAAGIALTFDDRRVLPNTVLGPMRDFSLRDYQAMAVQRLTKISHGTVVIPCGGGKTGVALGSIARLRTPTLVLVHTLDLAEQWRSELREKLGIEAGLIGDRRESIEPVTVGVVQSLVRWAPQELDALLGLYGLLVTDEVHHVPSNTFRRIVNLSPSRYRIGLTATPEREDGLSPVINLFFGPELVNIGHRQLVEAGVLKLPEIRFVPTDFTFPYMRQEDWVPMLSAMVDDKRRNQLIVEAIAREAHAGHTCLALSGRIDHCHRVVEGLSRLGITAEVLTSEVKRERRKQLLDEARTGRRSVLVATSLADEGLDLPRLSRVFLTFPGRAKGRTEQRLGRLMRPHADKRDALLVDFVDRQVPILYRHHLERRRLYAEVLGVTPASLATGRPMSAMCAGAR